MNTSQSNIKHLFVGINAGPKTSGQVTVYTDMTDGHIAFLNESNTAVSTLSGVARFRIVQRSGTRLLYSPYIETAKLGYSSITNTVAPVQQVSYIGYNCNGSGSIQAINSNVYMLRLLIKGHTKEFGNKQMLKFASYKSDSAATQQEVAQGLLDNLRANFADETLCQIKFEMVNSFLDAANKLEANATVVQYATTFTATNSGEYGTNVAPVVGDYVRFGSIGGGTALTDAVYRITALSLASTTMTFTVDRPIQVATGTYATATADAEIIPAASLLNFGIKCTGVANPFQVGKWKWFVTEFEIQTQDCGTTTITYTTAANQGKGYGAQIQEEQYLLQGNWGNKYRADEYAPSFINDAVETTQYNMINFGYRMDGGEQLGFRVTSPAEVMIALADNTSNNNLVLDVLQTITGFTASDFS